MKYPTPFIIAALVCSTAAAGPEAVTCDSPCDCHNAHGEARWSVKSDAWLPPTDASEIQAVTPSDMFSWPGPDAALTRAVNLISDVLPFGSLWYTKPDDAVSYATFSADDTMP